MKNRKYFDVLVRTPGGLKWKPVNDCINHAEAREQGEAQYAGEIIQTRFNGVRSDEDDEDSSFDGDAAFGLVLIGGGIILAITLWPLFLLGGAIYLGYKLYKKFKK